MEAFGRLMTVEQVVEAVPLMLCLDGPREGWVYDYDHLVSEPAELAPPGFGTVTYEYRGELLQASDGRFMRGMRLRRTESV